MRVEYRVISHAEIDNTVRGTFAEMLRKQGKVKGNLETKADRCKLVCIASVNDTVVAIGGIKPKTASDFTTKKAGVLALAKKFEWELGYLYTDREHNGRGIGSNVARLLVEAYGKGNLMASTEIATNPAMVHILEKHGFRLFGTPWKSGIHTNFLGLFLQFE